MRTEELLSAVLITDDIRHGRMNVTKGEIRNGREYFKAVCSKCGRECEVPFRPTQGKEVLCNDCFKKRPRDNDRRRRF